MMAVKVGINGFGRIGRQVLKAIKDFHPNELEVVAFNDIGDLKQMAHLLKYDSNYGRFDGTVEVGDGELIVDGKKVKAFKETDPALRTTSPKVARRRSLSLPQPKAKT
jgi:glyceraldehyde 3-phosphate dehydrogenase